MTAVATPDFAPQAADGGYELPVSVQVADPQGQAVFEAVVRMWVSPRH